MKARRICSPIATAIAWPRARLRRCSTTSASPTSQARNSSSASSRGNRVETTAVTQKIPCTICGCSILPLTARRTGGVCRPCYDQIAGHVRAKFRLLRVPALSHDDHTIRGPHSGAKETVARGVRVFLSYPWPGNLSELQAVLELCVVHSRGDTGRMEDLPSEMTGIRWGGFLPR